MGVVIGETAIVGYNVLLYQGVTLGGTGKETGKRHPTLGNNIVVGTGAKILGNITIGDNSYIGANAVVIKNVPSNSTVVGIPGRITKQEGQKIDLELDHMHVSDPIMENMSKLLGRIKNLEAKTGCKPPDAKNDVDFNI
jgi:serine O-acetyltransferase